MVADRPLARALLAMVSSADRPQSSHPSVRTVVEAITAHGASIREAYDLWPSATDPGLAYPRRAPLVRKWIQRSGFLGVGGRSIWVRAAVRSPLLTPLLKLLTPAVALVIEARREAA